MAREPRRAPLALLAAALLAAGHAGAAIEAGAEPARRFGYSIGDLVHQTLLIRPAPGRTLADDGLPAPGRAGRWLQRRAVRVAADGDGWRVEVEYQLINAPPAVTTIALPALQFRLRDGSRSLVEHYPETPLTVAPLLPGGALAGGGEVVLRPDAGLPAADTAARWQRLRWYALGGLLLVLAWAADRFGLGRGGARPFAAAVRELRRRGRQAASDAASPEAMRVLHRAFDAAAGFVVVGDALDRLFAARPALAPARDGVIRFFAASRARFFDADPATRPVTGDELLALARRLAALERGRG